MGYMKPFLKSKGDLVTILRTPPVQFYASLKRSTRATYSLISREHFFEGLIEAESNLQGGEYFTLRDETYMVQTTDFDKESEELSVYVARTNAVIDVKRETETIDEYGNVVKTWVPIESSLPVFVEIATRSLKQEDEGLLDQAIYTFQVPSAKDTQVLDRIVFEGKDYKLDSKDPTGMRGIVRLQVSPDFRP
jgi:hypothetical protein